MTIFTLSFIGWALLHSVTAASFFKRSVRKQIGDEAYNGLYRLVYNLFATVTFLPVFYALYIYVPTTAVWNITTPYEWAFLLIRGGGAIGLIVSLLQTDLWEFAGIRQAIRYFAADKSAAPTPQLVTVGVYGWVRHPLYLFSMMMIWFSPLMTLNGLIFNLLVTLYFWIGSSYEEKRLETEFGAAYTAYKQRVPRFIPIPFRT